MAHRAASTNPNHIDPYFGTSYGDDFRLEHVTDAVVRFANGDVCPSADDQLVPVGQSSEGTDLYLVAHEGEAVKAPREFAIASLQKRVARAREYAIEVLDVAAQGIGPLSTLVRSFDPDLIEATDLALYPLLKFTAGGRPALKWRISGPSQMEQWIRFAAVMIADAARGAATDIGRCQLPSCGRFFHVVRTGPGKPSTKYCPGTDHMERAHQANSTLRSQRKRQKDRRRAARPK